MGVSSSIYMLQPHKDIVPEKIHSRKPRKWKKIAGLFALFVSSYYRTGGLLFNVFAKVSLF